MRLQTFYIYRLTPGGKNLSDPRSLMKFKHDEPLPDEEAEIIIPTPEQWEELDERMAKIHEKPPEN